MRDWGASMPALRQALQAAALRQAVIANNLANATTPGFKPARVAFEEAFRQALARQQGDGVVRTHPLHRGGRVVAEPQVVEQKEISLTPDGNAVDMELEMARLAENQVQYAALVRQLSDQLTRIRLAITDGRG